jgi:dienelactone hydrolase
LSFSIPGQSKRDLLVRVSYPDPSAPGTGDPFPVILFSHGEGASKDEFALLVDHWASHGYVTVQPTHVDSDSLGYKPRSQDREKVLASRIEDMTFLRDHLDDIAAQSPALSGRIATDKIAVGGHGSGALTALALAGLPLRGVKPEKPSDARVNALLTLNGAGPSMLTGDDWHAVKVPVFAAAGTNDPGQATAGGLASWRWRLGAYELTEGMPRYALSIPGGDHTLGGLIAQAQPGTNPDSEGLAALDALSTAFLDEVFAANRTARQLLDQSDVAALTRDHAFLERAG